MRKHGLTLIEFMIVVAILGLVTSIVATTLFDTSHRNQKCVEWYTDGMMVCHEGLDGKEVCTHSHGHCLRWENR